MARQRMVKPEFFDSESLGACSVAARLAFIGLWVMGDDYGNQKMQVSRLKTKIFPYDSMTDGDFVDLLCELEEVGCIKGYTVDGDRYITVPNFQTYQTVRKPSKSSIPEPPKSVSRQRQTKAVREWRTGTSPVAEHDGTTAPVTHQYGTSDAQKKEVKKEVVVLQQQLPKEGAAADAAADGTAPPSAPCCPLCGTALERTGMPDPDWWWCGNCKDFFAREKVVA